MFCTAHYFNAAGIWKFIYSCTFLWWYHHYTWMLLKINYFTFASMLQKSILFTVSREDSYSASRSLWWLFADQQFWTAWVRHRQSWSHTGDCKTSRHHTHSHSSKCQALAEKKGGSKNFSVKCVWGCYFYSVSKLQRHHAGGSGCQDLNSSTWSFLMWWKPYTDPQLFLLFDSFWLMTRRALISSWTCP